MRSAVVHRGSVRPKRGDGQRKGKNLCVCIDVYGSLHDEVCSEAVAKNFLIFNTVCRATNKILIVAMPCRGLLPSVDHS